MKTDAVRCCVLIPVYRHLEPLPGVLDRVEKAGLPCFIIDDHNLPPLRDILATKWTTSPLVTLLRMPVNSGKGVACVEGCRKAYAEGYTHAIFMDADGQHDGNDLARLVELMHATPEAMILGRPIFDPSAPLSRRLGRWVSNIWAWIETLSFQIKDSLYGYRGVPLAPFVKIAERDGLSERMDFDPDMLVRLFWEGVPVVSFDTRVQYPEDGVSNFDLWRDNLRLTRLHTRLFFGMLRRLPRLLKRHWTRL